MAVAMKRMRIERGESINDVAFATRVTQSQVSRIESGKTKNPRLSTLKKLAEHFGVSIEELMEKE